MSNSWCCQDSGLLIWLISENYLLYILSFSFNLNWGFSGFRGFWFDFNFQKITSNLTYFFFLMKYFVYFSCIIAGYLCEHFICGYIGNWIELLWKYDVLHWQHLQLWHATSLLWLPWFLVIWCMSTFS